MVVLKFRVQTITQFSRIKGSDGAGWKEELSVLGNEDEPILRWYITGQP